MPRRPLVPERGCWEAHGRVPPPARDVIGQLKAVGGDSIRRSPATAADAALFVYQDTSADNKAHGKIISAHRHLLIGTMRCRRITLTSQVSRCAGIDLSASHRGLCQACIWDKTP